MKQSYKSIIFIIASIFASNAYSANVYLSTYSLESGLTNTWGGGIQSAGFSGVRFNVEKDIRLTGITAYMQGSGEFFGAIVKVDSATGLPSISLNNVATQSLAYNTGNFNSYTRYDGVVVKPPGDHTLDFNLTLSSGYYVAFFGAYGGFGQENSGIIPFVDNPSLSLIPTSDYLINSGGTWFEAPSEIVRIEILADEITAVPLPPSILLFLSGGILFIYRKKKYNK